MPLDNPCLWQPIWESNISFGPIGSLSNPMLELCSDHVPKFCNIDCNSLEYETVFLAIVFVSDECCLLDIPTSRVPYS